MKVTQFDAFTLLLLSNCGHRNMGNHADYDYPKVIVMVNLEEASKHNCYINGVWFFFKDKTIKL